MLDAIFPSCVYDEDCPVGTVCAFRFKGDGSRDYPQPSVPYSDCLDCNVFYSSPGIRDGVRAFHDMIAFGKKDGLAFTTVRLGDRWPIANNMNEYCQNYLDDENVQAIHGDSPDFSRCLYIQEGLMRLSTLDFFVLLATFLIVCVSCAADREQQLFTKEIRYKMLPSPLVSWRSASFYFVEIAIEAMCAPDAALRQLGPAEDVMRRPFTAMMAIRHRTAVVPCATVLLVVTNELDATSILLNGAAISFILVIDDTLPPVVLSTTDRRAIDSFAQQVANRATLQGIKAKATAFAGTVLVGLITFSWGITLVGCVEMGGLSNIFLLCMLASGRMVEEMVGAAMRLSSVRQLPVRLLLAMPEVSCGFGLLMALANLVMQLIRIDMDALTNNQAYRQIAASDISWPP